MKLLGELILAARRRAKIGRQAAVLCEDHFGVAAAVASQIAGNKVQPYAVTPHGKVPHDLQRIADRLGWELKVIVPRMDETAADFYALAVLHRCFKTYEMELGYLAMQVCEAADETDVWLSIPRWKSRRYAWRNATQIAAHYEKTLFNPYLMTQQTQIDDYQLGQMVREAEALAEN